MLTLDKIVHLRWRGQDSCAVVWRDDFRWRMMKNNLPNYTALSNLIQLRMQSKHINILIDASINIYPYLNSDWPYFRWFALRHLPLLVHGQSRNGPFGFAVLRLFVPSPAEALERQEIWQKSNVVKVLLHCRLVLLHRFSGSENRCRDCRGWLSDAMFHLKDCSKAIKFPNPVRWCQMLWVELLLFRTGLEPHRVSRMQITDQMDLFYIVYLALGSYFIAGQRAHQCPFVIISPITIASWVLCCRHEIKLPCWKLTRIGIFYRMG